MSSLHFWILCTLVLLVSVQSIEPTQQPTGQPSRQPTGQPTTQPKGTSQVALQSTGDVWAKWRANLQQTGIGTRGETGPVTAAVVTSTTSAVQLGAAWSYQLYSPPSGTQFSNMGSPTLFTAKEDKTNNNLKIIVTGGLTGVTAVQLSTSPAVAPSKPLWFAPIGSVTSTPLATNDNLVYVVSDATAGNGTRLWCFDGLTGETKWTYAHPQSFDRTQAVCKNAGKEGKTCTGYGTAASNRVFGGYIPNSNLGLTTSANNNALSATYVSSWCNTYSTSSPSLAMVKNVPTIIFGSLDGYVYAVQGPAAPATKPKLLWSKLVSACQIRSSPALSPDGKTLYLGGDDNYLYALDVAMGNVTWKSVVSTAKSAAVQSSPLVTSNGAIYVGGTDNSLYSYSAAGSLAWTYGLKGTVFSSPALVGNNIVAADFKGQVVMVDPLGKRVWNATVDSTSIASSLAVGSNNVIYGATSKGSIFALEPSTGKLLGSYWKNNTKIASSPILDTSGYLYLSVSDGTLVGVSSAIKSEKPTPSPTPAPSPGPTIKNGDSTPFPSSAPSARPTDDVKPTAAPSPGPGEPTRLPSPGPGEPTRLPSPGPSAGPTIKNGDPTPPPSAAPSARPTAAPSPGPTFKNGDQIGRAHV